MGDRAELSKYTELKLSLSRRLPSHPVQQSRTQLAPEGDVTDNVEGWPMPGEHSTIYSNKSDWDSWLTTCWATLCPKREAGGYLEIPGDAEELF